LWKDEYSRFCSDYSNFAGQSRKFPDSQMAATIGQCVSHPVAPFRHV
jgi:hypothetical protein